MGRKKLTYEEVKNYIEGEEGNGCKLISKEYISSNKLLEFKCRCGNSFFTTFDKFKSRNKRQCNECGKINKANNCKYKYIEIKTYIEIESNSGCKLLTKQNEYINSRQILKIMCHCGKLFNIDFTRFKNRKQECNKCIEENRIYNNFMNKKNEVKLKINELGFNLLSNYESCDVPILIENNEGYKAFALYDYLLRGKNPSYFNSCNNYTIYNINKWIENKNKNFILKSNEYIDSNTDLIWKCKQCNEVWLAPWNRILKGTKCPYCNKNRPSVKNNLLVINPILCEEWDYNKNKRLPQEFLSNSHIYVFWKCLECGCSWKAMIKSRNRGSGCPQCNESKGEKVVRSWLIKNKIPFESQYDKFKDLLGVGNQPLIFDFVIYKDVSMSDILFICEYDGEQHFKPIDFEGKGKKYAKEKYIIYKEHDRRKNEYCHKNNISLLRISYLDFDKIEQILQKELNINNLKECVID